MTSYTVKPVLLLLLLWSAGLFGQSSADAVFPPRPEPAVYVHDYAGWLNPAQKQQLEARLIGYFDSTSTQIVVMIRPDLGDYDKASYAFELGNRWGIGKKDKDNGLVMLIKSEPPDRGIFIATGYGTEGAVPDVVAARIIRNTMAPYFREQQYYEGINAGIDDLISALSGEFKAEPEAPEDAAVFVFIVFIFLFLLVVFLVRNARKKGAMFTGTGPVRDRGLGGGWWIGPGTGSWGGGGGWSSGGGSSSNWGSGGSFGGGSFGGGGAGGDW